MAGARRFFVEGAQQIDGTLEIAGADAHKIEHVLRLHAGDRIEIVDSTARAFAATIVDVGRAVSARVVEALPNSGNEPHLHVDVAQAVPKGSRMDFVVEKCTELGVATFLPFYSERSVGRSAGAEKIARWQRLARAAAQQCGRNEVPTVAEPIAFDLLAAKFCEYDAVLFAWELAPPVPMREPLSALPATGRALVVVGPEGGFSHAEAALAAGHGAEMVWLGRRVLRTDTAALVLLAVIGAFAS